MNFTDFVDVNNKKYYVSTTDTSDNGWETMIFEVKPLEEKLKKETGKEYYVDWSGIYSEWYENEKEAKKTHNYIVKNIKDYVKGDKEKKYV